MPNVGLTPTAIDNGIAALAESLSVFVNGEIDTEIANLNGSLPGINLIKLDVFGFLNSVVANPVPFGLVNLTDRCFDMGVVCANPEQYLFWDGIHPTEVGHAALGEFAYAQIVPVPPAVILFGSALTLLGWFRRRGAH